MPDDLQPPRKRGRPPKAPGESIARPNVSLRVKQELYDHVAAQARANGRSLSEEMGRQVEDAFSASASDVVRAAVEAAIEKTSQAKEAEMLKFFGGKHGLSIAKGASDLFRDCLTRACDEFGVSDPREISGEAVSALKRYMSEGQDKIIDDWLSIISFARLMSSASSLDLHKVLSMALDDPALKAKLDEQYARLFPNGAIKDRGE